MRWIEDGGRMTEMSVASAGKGIGILGSPVSGLPTN
jgi:hypothetical protein